MTFRVELKGLEKLNSGLTSKPLRSTLRRAFIQGIAELHKEIRASVYSHYSILENIDKVKSTDISKQDGKIVSVSIKYRYNPVRLSSYPTLQYRATTRNRTLRVSRQKKGKYQQKIVTPTAWATYVKVKKKYKLVTGRHGPDNKGRAGFMGWLHTGKLGRNRFRSSGIYERLQQATWEKSKRLPTVELYGPTFTQIVMSPEVQRDIQNSKAIERLIAKIEKQRI
jgi:hypothetical protein